MTKSRAFCATGRIESPVVERLASSHSYPMQSGPLPPSRRCAASTTPGYRMLCWVTSSRARLRESSCPIFHITFAVCSRWAMNSCSPRRRGLGFGRCDCSQSPSSAIYISDTLTSPATQHSFLKPSNACWGVIVAIQVQFSKSTVAHQCN